MAFTANRNNQPARPDSNAVMQEALAAMPDIPDDDEVLPPGAEDTPRTHAADAIEFIEDDEPEGEPAAAAPVAAPKGPAPKAAAPAAAASAPAAAPTTTPEGGQPLAPETPDPWADTVDLEYADGDTGEKFVVRAPKTYADKVKNGYARRSIMDRNSSYLGKHRAWIEPLVANKQFDDVAPVLQRAMEDPEFADYVASAYMRRMNGMPLNVQQQQAVAAVEAARAETAPAAPASTQAVDPTAMLAALDNDPDIDDYTRGAMKKALAPLVTAFAAQQAVLSRYEQGVSRQQQQEQQARAQQAEYERQRRLGDAGRRALMQTFPDEFNETTPREKWMQVHDYIQNANLFGQYGEAASTYILAAQALRSPAGLAGIGRPMGSSPAAQSVASVRAQGEALAAAAAADVARSTATSAPGGVEPSSTPRKKTPPRYVKGPNNTKRPITPKELALWYEKNPEAL